LIRYCMFTFIIGLTKDMPTNHWLFEVTPSL
jgi:hypothetical protein